MYLYGASGHAKVIIEILEALNIPVEGLFDDDPGIHSLLGYEVRQLTDPEILRGKDVIISIGENRVRKNVADKLRASFRRIIHPKTCVSLRAVIEDGTVVMPGVTINSEVNIGTHCIVNTNASVDHDCFIHDFVHISPNVTLCGGIEVGEGTQVGAGAVIIPGIHIGKWVTIGAGSVVINNVPDKVTVVGNPAHVIKSK